MDISSEASLCNENLFKPENKKYLDYLQIERGLNQDTLDNYNIGVDGSGNITFPIPDPVTPVGIKKRTNPFNPGQNKYLNASGVESLIFNKISLDRSDLKNLVICEGEIDVMSLEQYAIPAITKTTGITTKFSTQEIEDIISVNPEIRIYFGLDNDAIGKKTMYQYASDFYTNEHIHFLEVPSGKDWNEFIVQLKSQNFDEKSIKTTLKDTLLKASSAPAYYMKYAKENPRPQIDLINLAEVKHKDLEFLINPLVIKNSINQIVGKSGDFKSFLSLDIAVSCLNRKKFLGLLETTPINTVILFDMENMPSRVQDRIKQLGGILENFLILKREVYFDKEVDIVEKLENTLKAHPNSLLIIDTLRRVNQDLEENDSGSVNRFYTKLFPLRKLGTIIVLHHTPKLKEDGKAPQARGSGDITAAVDSEFGVVKTDEEKNKFVRLEIYHTKPRYTEKLGKIVATYNFDEETNEISVESHFEDNQEVNPISKLKKLEEFIAAQKEAGCTLKNIKSYGKEILKISEHTVEAFRDKLLNEKKIVESKYFKGKEYYYFHKDFVAQQINAKGSEPLS